MLDRDGRGSKEAVSIILNLPPDEKSLETTPNFSLSIPFTGKNKLNIDGLWISFLQFIKNNINDTTTVTIFFRQQAEKKPRIVAN